jgi:hypothetical protein
VGGKKRKKDDVRHFASLSNLSISPHSFISMPKDTRDRSSHKSLCNEIVLTILRLADEDMLRESDNAVYLGLKRELDDIR